MNKFESLSYDSITDILSHLTYSDLIKVCSSNQKLAQLCKNNDFWHRRLRQKFNITSQINNPRLLSYHLDQCAQSDDCRYYFYWQLTYGPSEFIDYYLNSDKNYDPKPAYYYSIIGRDPNLIEFFANKASIRTNQNGILLQQLLESHNYDIIKLIEDLNKQQESHEVIDFLFTYLVEKDIQEANQVEPAPLDRLLKSGLDLTNANHILHYINRLSSLLIYLITRRQFSVADQLLGDFRKLILDNISLIMIKDNNPQIIDFLMEYDLPAMKRLLFMIKAYKRPMLSYIKTNYPNYAVWILWQG